jgi:EmrB/QacA subfamily drug resistance transporter
VTSRGRRLAVLAICCLSLFIVGIDTTIVNVALPSLSVDLHATVSGLQWVVDAYTLVLASLLVLGGSSGDRLGRKRVFLTGLVVFSAASLLCSLAPTLPVLVVFRMVQGVGGSMLNPVALSIITNTFPDRRERAQAIGVWAALIGVSMALGPVLGGILVDSVGWRSVFWINIPIGLAAIVLTVLFVPESRAERPRRVDPVGQVLVLTVLAALVYGIIEAPGGGLSSPRILAAFAVAVAALVALLRYEPRREDALLEFVFFRSVPFTGAAVVAVAGFAALGSFLFVNTLYLQETRGLSPLDAGLYTLPMAAMTVVAATVSGWILGARGPRLPLVGGGLGLTLGALMLTRVEPGTSLGWLFAAYFLFGSGLGLINPAIGNTAVSGMPPARAGVAAAIASAGRQVGASIGVALVGAATASALRTPGASGRPGVSTSGWWIVVGCAVVVAAVGLLSTTRRAQATADRLAVLIAD